jgi:expansin (peptidoglycan-binding protein)
MRSFIAPIIIANLICTIFAHPHHFVRRQHPTAASHRHRNHDLCTTWGTVPIQTSISPSPDVSTTSAGQPQNSILNSTGKEASTVLGSDFETGDLTYYAVGLGACGEDDTGRDMTANIVAMSSEVMGPQSNDNPMCGRMIKIYNFANGKEATGVIRDKCPSCKKGSIDVSQKLFQELGDLAQGRIPISWTWIS